MAGNDKCHGYKTKVATEDDEKNTDRAREFCQHIINFQYLGNWALSLISDLSAFFVFPGLKSLSCSEINLLKKKKKRKANCKSLFENHQSKEIYTDRYIGHTPVMATPKPGN